MAPTSHFIGISLHPKLLQSLFEDIERYFMSKNEEEIIIMQTLKSAHITLYYFNKNLSFAEKDSIKEDIKEIKENITEVSIQLGEHAQPKLGAFIF